jgi:hypothetical protein
MFILPCVLWLQETELFSAREQDPVVGREQVISLASSEVNYEILYYT